jgi:hypothetical protein
LSGQPTNPVLMLCTDGEPTSSPAVGEVEALRQRLQQPHEFTLSTVGYGSKVPSDRLMQLAQAADGIYGYCPLPGMALSVFLNFVAQCTTCITQRAEFEFKCAGGQVVKAVRNVNQGHRLNFFLPGVKADFAGRVTVDGQRFDFPACRDASSNADNEGLTTQYYRAALIKLLKDGLATPANGQALVTQLVVDVESFEKQSVFLQKLAKDLMDDQNPDGDDAEAQPQLGKINKAFVPAKFAQWGKDELRALVTFHEAEVCGVLLDATLQEYQSPPFATRRRYGWCKFCQLPRMQGESKVFDQIPDNNPSIIKDADGKSVKIDQIMIGKVAGSFIQGG